MQARKARNRSAAISRDGMTGLRPFGTNILHVLYFDRTVGALLHTISVEIRQFHSLRIAMPPVTRVLASSPLLDSVTGKRRRWVPAPWFADHRLAQLFGIATQLILAIAFSHINTEPYLQSRQHTTFRKEHFSTLHENSPMGF